MFKKGILFYHEAAGQGDVHTNIGQVTQHLSRITEQLLIYQSRQQGDIYKYCLKLNSSECDVLYILGGDGTVHELINGVLDAGLNLPIGILPGGTFNDFTKTLNLPATPELAAAAISNMNVKHIDVMKSGERYILNFLGLGLIVENSEGVNQETKSRIGKFSYFLSTIRTVTNPTFFPYRLVIDGKEVSGTTAMIIVANGQYVGGNRIPLADLSAEDGLLDVFIFKESGFKLFRELIIEKTTEDWNEISQNIDHYRGRKISIATEQEMPVDVDGEIDLKTPLDVEVIAGRLRMFAVPEII